MEDLSTYLAERTCKRVKDRVAGSPMRGNLFENQGSSFKVWGDYHVTFRDSGDIIDIVVDNSRPGAISKLLGKIEQVDLTIPQNYRPFIERVNYSARGTELIISVRPKIRGSGKRKQNKDKMFDSVDVCATSKLLKAAYESTRQ
jgi:hypothetical protein